MPATAQFTRKFLEEVLQGTHDVLNNSITVCLMNTTFAFDPDTMETYAAAVDSDEIATGYGYTKNTMVLSTPALDSSVSGTVTLTGGILTWTATGGDLPAVGAACLIINGTLMLCIDFGTDYTTTSGKLFKLNFTGGACSVAVV